MDRFQWARFSLENSDAAVRNDRLATLQRLVEGDHGDAATWNEIGKLRFVSMEFSEAEAAYRKAVGMQPVFADAWVNLAWLLDSQHRPAQAQAAFEQAAQCDPDRVDVWERLALMYLATDRYEEAANAFATIA